MLDLEVTRRCNLRCDYCFVGWSRDWTSDMPREAALEVVGEGAGLFETLHLTGGEPFVYEHVWEVIKAGLSNNYKEVFINTNATTLTDESVRRLASYAPRVSLSVSLDGPEQLHDAVRGRGRFRKSARTLAALLGAGVPATVNTVVTPTVLGVLAPFLFALRDDFPKLSGVTLFPVGVGQDESSRRPGAQVRPLTPRELIRLARLVALVDRTGLSVGVGAYPVINPLLLEYGYPASRLYQCTAGRGRVCVHADLTVSPCHPVKEAVYGHWRKGLLRELGAFPAHRRLAARDFDGCRSCEHQETCGHCRAFVQTTGEPLFGNDKICVPVLDEGLSAVPRPFAEAEPTARRMTAPKFVQLRRASPRR
ncbi:MAG TPA: radical SAM protein [Pyrinomonadaceae bacterium]|nr:radical SAM protein [Pyrinomonadaceae bacterium]